MFGYKISYGKILILNVLNYFITGVLHFHILKEIPSLHILQSMMDMEEQELPITLKIIYMNSFLINQNIRKETWKKPFTKPS